MYLGVEIILQEQGGVRLQEETDKISTQLKFECEAKET